MRVLLVLVLLVLAGCATPAPPGSPGDATNACAGSPAPPDAAWKAEAPRVRVATSRGNFTAKLEPEAAPLTTDNFLNLTRQGFYDGQLVHRVVANFVIQAGDPNTKTNESSTWGAGGPGYAIPDEFNPALRHDAAGVLSMANAGPDTGGSQFFVTLAATPHLDDRHSVFGRVEEGLDVVQAIGKSQVNADDQPQPPVRIEKVEALDAAPFDAKHEVGVHVVLADKKAEAGRPVRFAVVVENAGNVRDRPLLTADVPAGWSCRVERDGVVPAGTARVVFLNLTPPAGAKDASIPLSVQSAWNGTAPAHANVNVTITTLGAQVREGDRVTANYVGFLPDGRLFDTSVEKVAQDPAMPKFTTTGGYQPRGAGQYQTFGFTVGSGVIAGFTNLAKTAKVGETVTGYIPQADAYAAGTASVYQRPLTGKDLVFELEIVKT